MGRHDAYLRAVDADAVHLAQKGTYIGHMLDDMAGIDHGEAVGLQGPVLGVQVKHHIDAWIGMMIRAQRTAWA